METVIDAGRLSERLEVLELRSASVDTPLRVDRSEAERRGAQRPGDQAESEGSRGESVSNESVTTPKIWTWETARKTWGQAEPYIQKGRELFSQVGVGARGVKLVLRRQDITLHNALLWKGQHLFLTAILPRGRGHLDVTAALVRPETVRLVPDGGDQGMTFPGVLTEKYLAHRQEWPMSVNDLELVLVVPKAITLRPGRLVECRGAAWEVLVPHELDEFKNEYEIGRRAEL